MLQEFLTQKTSKGLVHRFPSDVPPAQSLSLEIGDVRGQVLNSIGLAIRFPQPNSGQVRQKRFSLVELEFSQKVILREARLNFSTSELTVLGQLPSPLVLMPQQLVPIRSSLITYYRRKNKNKVLHAAYRGAGPASASIETVFQAYKQVVAVDTNCALNRHGEMIAVTTALVVRPKDLDGMAAIVSSELHYQAHTINPPGNPEVHGIWEFLSHMHKRDSAFFADQTALITDTEYSNVRGWHERRMPFFGDHLLPDRIDLLYATADAGSDEFIPNRLIKACDSLSSKRLRELCS